MQKQHRSTKYAPVLDEYINFTFLGHAAYKLQFIESKDFPFHSYRCVLTLRNTHTRTLVCDTFFEIKRIDEMKRWKTNIAERF